MPTRDELLALAKRVEKEAPTYALEIEIECIAFGCRPAGMGRVVSGLGLPRPPRRFMTSLEVAVALAEPHYWTVAKGRLTPEEPIWGASVYFDEAGDHKIGEAETDTTAAACLTAAALRGLAGKLP